MKLWRNLLRLRRAFSGWHAIASLAVQFLTGVQQLLGFFLLQGQHYIAFAESFVVGTMVAAVMTFNLESETLARRFDRGIRIYWVSLLLIGSGVAVAAFAAGSAAPHWISFASWGICSRIFLAWSSTRRLRIERYVLAAALALPLFWALDINLALVGSHLFLLVVLAPWRRAGLDIRGGRALTSILASMKDFARYLPHTLSGFVLAYSDRYVAFHFAVPVVSEAYLRTVQIVSWATFMAMPLIFQFRARLVRDKRIELRRIVGYFLAILGALALLSSAIMLIILTAGRDFVVAWAALPIVIFGLALGQAYQMTSVLNFIERRYRLINRITMSAAGVAAGSALLAIVAGTSEIALALVLMAGWLAQVVGTVYWLARLQYQADSDRPRIEVSLHKELD